ncbi:transposase family protein [Streptomyces shenzhenensis]|uniref:transposase family protein n=1 Tax=Streptomyces shenzhenensis TaxID=943815 RepID=UPI003D8A6A00
MRRRWSARHKRHGLPVIALTDVKGRMLWTSPARPARGSEITVCRRDDLVGRLRAAGLGAIADLGFVGLDGGGDDSSNPAVITGSKKPRSARHPPRHRIFSEKISTRRAVAPAVRGALRTVREIKAYSSAAGSSSPSTKGSSWAAPPSNSPRPPQGDEWARRPATPGRVRRWWSPGRWCWPRRSPRARRSAVRTRCRRWR